MSEELEKCGECKWTYPMGYCQPMFVAGGGEKAGYTIPICGLCALSISNAQLGVERKRFSGKMAEQLRQDAFHWRKRHPEHKPVEVTNVT